jgi:hypothetical protein
MEAVSLQLGYHHGNRVMATHPCSDLCPDYTTRVVYYDLEPGASCEASGGVNEEITVPVGIGAFPIPFCVPRALVGKAGLMKDVGYIRRQ